MDSKGPEAYSLLTYAWVLALACLGSVARYAERVNVGEATWWPLWRLFGELVVAAFVGLLTFWGCQSAGLGGLESAVLIGLAGHLGPQALPLLRQKFWGKSSRDT